MISENLELLKKLDSSLYDEITLRVELISWYRPRNQLLDHLQGCLQRAIVAKGWVFEIEGKVGIDGVCPPKAGYIADVYELDKGYDGDHFSPRHKCLLNESVADSPADALLAAYIEAIQ